MFGGRRRRDDPTDPEQRSVLLQSASGPCGHGQQRLLLRRVECNRRPASQLGSGDDDEPGWWDILIGPGKAIDTDRFFVVCPTLLGSCRRQGINPFEYLKDLFTRLPAAKITQIGQFTPRAWAKAKMQKKSLALAA